ncbi:unnamed protein product [Penicillium glandicola]
MDPISFAVGIIGLAGLFNTCLDAVERFDSWKDYDSEFRSLVAQFKAQKLRLIKWGLDVGLEDNELSYEHNALLDDPKIESTVKELLLAIDDVCRDEDKTFSTPMLGKDEKPTKDQLFHRHAPRESKRHKLGWVLRTKAKRVAQVEQFSKLVETLHNLIPVDDSKAQKGRKPTGDRVLEEDAWRSELKDILKRIEIQIEDEYRRDLHAWLLGSSSTNDLYEIFSERKIDGTCEWVLGQPWLLDWISPHFPTERAKILWINGPAGFGKSVICARVIDHISSSSKDPVAHFFFSSDFESRRDPFVAIRSWLSQLIWHPIAFSLAREILATQQGQKATRGDVLKLLRDIVMDIPRCTFVLDGLDECRWVEQDYSSNDGASMVTFLEALRQAIAGTSTRILIVSRDEPEIRACLFNEAGVNDAVVTQHSITPEDVRYDLEMFSRSIVDKKLSTKTEATKGDIAQKLAERCNGQFLWVQMQEGQLRSGKSQKQLEKAINSTPPGLEKTYDREWMGISNLAEDDRERTISLLRWAAFALRPLSVCEITGALLISAECDEVRFEGIPDGIDENYIRTEVVELCGSLIEIRSPQTECAPGLRTIHLAHFSVKEYLLCNLPAQGRLLQLNSSLKSSTERIENTLAAKMCLCYVNCEEVWQEASEGEENQILSSFRDYAARSWYQHASVGNMRDSELVEFVNQLFDTENPNWASWKGWFDLNDDESQEMRCFYSKDDLELSDAEDEQNTLTTSMSPLYYATWLGLIDTMDLLLRNKKYLINEQGNFGRTPLAAACERGNLEATKKLLDNDADIDIVSDNGHNALHAAACNGHAEVVTLLLEKGARIYDKSDGSVTPLYCACLDGHFQVAQILLQWQPDIIATHKGLGALAAASSGGFLDIVQLLIERGANINAPNRFESTPLMKACYGDHIEVVRLLLDEGAEVNHPGQLLLTPVNLASYYGLLDIAQLLIERGADINAPDEDGETPLYHACQKGHIEIVRLLLDRGADINAPDEDGETPLYHACRKGHTEIVRLLLDRGADINAPDEDGETPLCNACYNGHIETVRLLLDRGADIGARDNYDGTPLHTACYNGQIEIMRLLLDRGAYIGAQNNFGGTPLHTACYNGDIETVHLLLDRGAYIEARNEDQETPLYNACYKGHIEVVRLLLDRGAEVHHPNKSQMTGVQYASYHGFLDIVLLLLERGADVNVHGTNGRTPLHHACYGGHIEVVEHLIKKGADIEFMGRGVIPLTVACERGFLDIVTTLLEKGANIARVNQGGITPLHAASINESIEVADLLIKKGAVVGSAWKGGITPLHFASLGDSLGVINLLLDKGADIESVDVHMGSPLHIASVCGNLGAVNLLLERGATIESGNFDDSTLLHYVSPHSQLEVISNFLHSKKLRIDIKFEKGCTPLFYVVARGPSKVVKLLLPRLPANVKDRCSVMQLLTAARNGYEEAIEQLITLAELQSNLKGLGRDLIWWAIGTGRGRILGLIRQWCYTQSYGARVPQASNDKLWSFVSSDLERICDVCTQPILFNTSYRRCEGCNNFNICSQCCGFKVTFLDTAHEWSSS